MNRMRRIGLDALAFSLLAGAVGCGGSGALKSTGAALPQEAPVSGPSGAYAPPAAEQGESSAAPAGDDAPGVQGQPAPAPPSATSAMERPSAKSSADFGGEGVARSAPRREVAPEPAARPGLGTQWGETRVSRISTVPFIRADAANPFAIAGLFYNDAEGARAMASATGFRRTSPQTFTLAGGAVAVGLRAENGGFLSGFVAGEKSYVVGEAGQRYSIVLRNLTPNRLECVVSVDGLDVLDGQPAAFAKRGYLVDPHGELEIDGFRQSMNTVAAFRFGSVRGSYASQKHGETRNVGVIGVALFHERGTTPWTPDEVRRREEANPFPGQFATPPGQ
jgi:hypothetical protein